MRIRGDGNNIILMIFKNQNQASSIPCSVVMAMCWIFVILFGIWLQPHTVFIRHACLIIGALLGIYVITKQYRNLAQINSLPLMMLLLLLFWVTLHLLFFSKSYELQLHEYTKAWKKIALTIPFGIGLGLGLSQQINKNFNAENYYRVLYLGLLMPSFVYFVKLIATIYYPQIIGEVPKYLYLSSKHLEDEWGVSRAAYTFFCLPAFALSMARVAQFFDQSPIKFPADWLYFFGLVLPPIIFFIENDRTGVLYCVLTCMLTIFLSFKSTWKKTSFKKFFSLSILILVLVLSIFIGIQRNSQWKTLIADAKIAVQIEEYDNWKYLNTQPKIPLMNEMGVQVSESNYDRAAWFIRGLQLLKQNPLGYGLMTLSFGFLNAIDFPGSQTSLSHSAWLDFALGYGLIGFFLLFGAALLAWFNGRNLVEPWRTLVCWVLGYWILLFLTKELSMEIFINAFILFIAICTSLSINTNSKS